MGVTINTNFWGDVVEELMALAVTHNEIVEGGHIFISDKIQKKRALNRITMSNIIQAVAATPTPQGQFTLDERALDPDDFMVYVEFDPGDFREAWEYLAPKGDFVFTELTPKVQAELLRQVIEGANGVNEYMGSAILIGDKTSGTPPFDRFNGIITKAKADADVIDVTGYASLDTSNIAAKLKSIKDQSRVATRRNSKFKMFTSVVDAEKYAEFQKAQVNKGVDVTSGGVMKIDGTPIIPLVGMPENTVFATIADSTRGSNIWLGVKGIADYSTVKVMPVQNNSDLWFFKMKMGADTQIKFGQDFSLYTA